MTAPNSPARSAPVRPTAAHSGGGRPGLRAPAPAVILTAVVAAAAVGAAVALAEGPARVPLAWGMGAIAVLLCAAVAVASRAAQRSRLLARRLEGVTQDTGRLLQEQARLADETAREQARLIDEFALERSRLAEQSAQREARLTAELAEERSRSSIASDHLTEELRQARRERAAAVSAAARTAARMQALATGMLADLRAMEERHSDEEVLADLLHIDHRTAQAGRLADSVAVLAGARSGRRWARPIAMESILRGAMGRISGYQRVRVHSASEAAVAGHAAEGVMHALAEILDNAANFSPPTAEVHVYVEEVPSGVIVSVEDSGLAMGETQLRRAERAVRGEEGDLADLTGTRLGLAVVGRLARKYGLTVSFRPSARGGTGVLVLIPQGILANPAATAPATVPVADQPAGLWPKPASAPDTGAGAGTSESSAPVHARAGADPQPRRAHEPSEGSAHPVGALPKRHRGRTLAEAEAHAKRSPARQSATGGAQPTAGDAETRVTRFNSFRQAVRAAGPDEQVDAQGITADETAQEPSSDGAARTATPAASAASATTAPSHPEGDTTS